MERWIKMARKNRILNETPKKLDFFLFLTPFYENIVATLNKIALICTPSLRHPLSLKLQIEQIKWNHLTMVQYKCTTSTSDHVAESSRYHKRAILQHRGCR